MPVYNRVIKYEKKHNAVYERCESYCFRLNVNRQFVRKRRKSQGKRRILQHSMSIFMIDGNEAFKQVCRMQNAENWNLFY